MLKVALRSCVSGEYPIASSNELESADVIVAQSFGTRQEGGSPGKVNSLLAEHAQKLAEYYDIPLIAQEEIADSLPKNLVHTKVSGDPSSSDGSGLDSWGVLSKLREIMGDETKPIIVAQAYHIGRVSLQAIKLGMDPRLPGDMPREFAPESGQWWTRSRGLWVARELPGMAVLKLQKKL